MDDIAMWIVTEVSLGGALFLPMDDILELRRLKEE
jgi:hypothetical protein